MPIAVQHLRRTYGDFTAVEDLSFDAAPGEIVGLIGPNGAGKTTTLRSLAGILRPTSGHVLIDGHDIVEDPIEAKRRLAFMPDEPHLFEYLTVEEHLRLVARIYGVDDFDRRSRALIEELELAGKERSLPGELSRGMRQKVVIACGLVRVPSVLLFDEPLTGLDPIGIRRMRETIVARGRAGRQRARVIAPPASGRGDLHEGHHHGSRTQGGRWHRRGARVAHRAGVGRIEPRADLPARYRTRR